MGFRTLRSTCALAGLVWLLVLGAAPGAAAQSIMLEWDPSGGLVGYKVHVGVQSGSYTQHFDVGSQTAFTFETATAGQRYCFAVSAYLLSSQLEGPNSGEVCGYGNAPPTLANPGNRTSTVGQAVTLQLVGADPANEPLTYSQTGLPPGLSLMQSTGYISGAGTTAGTYSVTVRAFDGVLTASQTFTWVMNAGAGDTTPPTATISAPTNGTTYSTTSSTMALGGTAADNVGVTQVRWSNDRGGSGVAAGTTNWSIASIPLQSGANVITITAVDAAGNQGTDALTATYTATSSDTTRPTASIATPTTGTIFSTTASTINLTGTAADNVGVTQVRWSNDRGGSGVANGTTSWAVASIALQSGANLIVITAVDAAGNQGTDSLTVTYAATSSDTTRPTVSVSTPTDQTYYSAYAPTVNLGGTASDNVGVTQVRWSNDRGGSGVATGTTNWSIAAFALLAGANGITITAVDAAGNQATDFISVYYNVQTSDTTRPTATISAPTSGTSYSTTSSTMAFGGTASDNVGVTQVRWSNDRGGSGVATGTTNWSIASIPLQSGANVITITAVDAAGNQGTDSLTATYTATSSDTTRPTATIGAPTSGTTYSTTASTIGVGGTASDNVGVTQVRWSSDRGGSGVATGTTSWSVSSIPLVSGTNVITVTAVDAAGNQGTDSLTVTYTATTSDSRRPNVSITAPTSQRYYSAYSPTVNLGGTASDNVGVTQVRWSNDRGGTGVATGTTSWSIAAFSLLPGANGITITAVDAAGNQQTDFISIFYNVTSADTTRPTASISTPTTGTSYSTTSTTIALSGAAADNVGVTQVRWSNDRGGSGVASGTTSWSISGIPLQSGTNIITVTAVDAAGNQGADSLTVTSTTSTPTPSTVTLSVQPLSGSARLTWSSAPWSSVNVYRNGALVTPYSPNDGVHTEPVPGPGTFTFQICPPGILNLAACSNSVSVTF